MERGVKHRPRRRSPLPFLLLAVAVVGCAFAVAVAAVVPMEADSPGGQDQALPTPMSGWLESKVRSMMREIVAAVEAEMQIASPSKVFAGIGAYMAEGLGEGFAREMQNVEKTIRRATASTVPEPQRPSGRISRNDNAARGVQVVQNIYANETSYAQQQREAAKQFRLIAREVMG